MWMLLVYPILLLLFGGALLVKLLVENLINKILAVESIKNRFSDYLFTWLSIIIGFIPLGVALSLLIDILLYPNSSMVTKYIIYYLIGYYIFRFAIKRHYLPRGK